MMDKNDKRKMLEAYATGASLRSLSERFGISKSAISQAVRRAGIQRRMRPYTRWDSDTDGLKPSGTRERYELQRYENWLRRHSG